MKCTDPENCKRCSEDATTPHSGISPTSKSEANVSEQSAQSGPSYAAETYCVVHTGETGWCVKHGDDLVCDVYAHKGEEMARRIATLLNTPPAGASDAVLSVLDKCFEEEISRVSTVEYNSNEICQWFWKQLRAAIETVLTSKAEGADARTEVEWLSIVRERDALIGELTTEANYSGYEVGARMLFARAASFISATPKRYPALAAPPAPVAGSGMGDG